MVLQALFTLKLAYNLTFTYIQKASIYYELIYLWAVKLFPIYLWLKSNNILFFGLYHMFT